MCVIIHQPRGTHLDKERAHRLWQRNPDGGGFAFVDNTGTIQIKKAMSFTAFWRKFETARSAYPGRW